MEPIDYAGALRRSWRLIVVLALIGAVVAVLIPASHAKKVRSALPYAATTIVGSPPNGTGSPLRAGVSSGQILFFATQSSTERSVISDAGLAVDPSQAPVYMSAALIPASGVSSTGASAILKRNAPTVVLLTGYGATPADALTVANTYAQDTGQAVATGLDASPKTSGVSAGYTVIVPAQVAATTKAGKSSLTASRKVRGLVGLGIGAVIAAGIVLLRELLDKRLRNAARTEANFGFPVVAEIPLVVSSGSESNALVAPVVDVVRYPESPGAEAYRLLRMSVMFEALAPLSGPTDPFALGFQSSMGDDGPGATPVASIAPRTVTDRQVILVVSAGTEPTRPHVAANLAAIYAEAGQRVVVISTGQLWLGGNQGRQTAGEIRPEDVEAQLKPSRLDNVFRLDLGHFVANSSQLVNRAPAIFDAVRTLSDLVIVEVPPLLAVHHTEALAHAVDVVLVVAECKYTTFDDARQAGDQLRRMEAPVMGVVLTNVRIPHSDVRHLGLPRSVVPVPEPDPEPEGEGLQAIGAGATAGTDGQSQH
jgi:Mrp family chromosome partitioning ATPase